MKLGEQFKIAEVILDKLRGRGTPAQLENWIHELFFLKYLCDEAKGKYVKELKAVGLKLEFFDEVNFEDLNYENLVAMIDKIKEPPLLADLFVSFEMGKESPFSEGQFKEIMMLLAQVDFLPALQKDQEEGSHEVGEAFLELMDSIKQGKRWSADGVTPKSLRELIAALNSQVETNEIYDPAIGVGALAIEVATKNKVKAIYGQEMAVEMVRQCKLLLITYGMTESAMNITQGDTLVEPKYIEEDKLRKFKNIVAIPPFNMPVMDQEKIQEDLYARYPERVSMRSSEMLFIYHILASLEEEGMASVLTPNGILFRGGAEAKMREELLNKNWIDCIIQLPGKMLVGTAIPTTLIILKKQRTRDDVLFMDLTGEVDKISKLTTQLSEATIQKACELYHNYTASDISQIVSIQEILANDSNLNATRYIVQQEEKHIDLNEVNETIHELEKKLVDIQKKIREKLK